MNPNMSNEDENTNQEFMTQEEHDLLYPPDEHEASKEEIDLYPLEVYSDQN